MADLNKIVQRYEVQSDTSGLDKIAAAADKAAASSKKLVDAANALGAASDKTEKSAISVSGQLARQTAKYDEATKALDAYTKYKTLVERAERLGVSASAENVRVLAALKEKHEEAAKATNAHSAAVGLNRSQMMELGHVARSLFDDLGAGTLGFRSLLQEGGRISQVLGEGSGGVGGTLKAMGGTVARLATGWVGLGVAVAAGAGVAGAAILRFSAQQDALARSLNGVGRGAGLTLGGLTGIVGGAAGSSGISLGSATSAAASLVSTGQIGGSILPGILGQLRPYSVATGVNLEDTGALFTKSFASPGKGAEELNSRLGFLDDKTRTWIDSLEASGQHLEAQRVLLDKVSEATATASDRTWTMTKAYRDLGEMADSWLNKIGARINANGNALLNGDTPEGRLAKLEYQLQSAQRGGLGFNLFGQGGNSGLQRSLAEQIGIARSDVEMQRRAQEMDAKRQADTQRAQQLSMQAGDVTRSLDPTLTRTRELDDRIHLLEGALGNPDISGRVTGGASAISRSLDAARNQRLYADPVTRIRDEGALSAQAIQAQTGAERTLIEARRAEIEVMATTGQSAQAAAKSLTIWNDAIAASNKKTEDAVRAARDDLSLSGLSPYERRRQEIQIRARDLLKDSTTGPSASLSPDDLSMTALDPFGDLSTSAKAFSGKRGARISGAEDAFKFAYQRSLVPAPVEDHYAVPAGALASHGAAADRFAPGNIVIPSTARANVNEYIRVSDQKNYRDSFLEPLKQANQELTLNENLLRARTAAFGKDTFELNRSIAAQELWNKLIQSGLNDAKLSADQTKQLSKGVEDYATKSAELQKKQDDEQKRQDLVSNVNDFGRNFVGGAANDFFTTMKSNPRDLVSQLSQGQQADYYAGRLSGNQVKSIVTQHQISDLFQKMAYDQGIDLIKTGLFGSGKKGGGDGLIGGLVKGAIGALGFADGGVMTSRGPLALRRYASGGVANSPQLAMYGEGSRPEAYVPLADGRTIPVSMKGGGGGPQISMGGHTIVVQGSADEKTLGQMRAELAASNRQMVADLQRNMGQMQAKWQQRNGS